MKVKKLIKELKNLDPELEVCVYAYHEQTTSAAHGVRIKKALKDTIDTYKVKTIHPADECNWHAEDLQNIVEIYGE